MPATRSIFPWDSLTGGLVRGLPEESGDLLPPGGEVPGVPKGGEGVFGSDEGVVSVEISRVASGVIAVEQHLFEQGRGDEGAHEGFKH